MSKPRSYRNVVTQTIEVKATDADVAFSQDQSVSNWPKVKVATSPIADTTYYVANGRTAEVKRYHIQDHPCPLCYHGRRGTGLVYSAPSGELFKTQYLKCRVCGHTWTNPVPRNMPTNNKPTPIDDLRGKLDAIDSIWNDLPDSFRQAFVSEMTATISRFTE